MKKRPLSKKFFKRPADVVARELLGCTLNRRMKDGSVFSAVIAETEAYTANDPASHSFKGESARNSSMFLEGGHFYVYLIYGVYFCLNVVTGLRGEGEAVLIRALQPLDGSRDRELMGPGRLCRFLGIDRRFDGKSCFGDDLWIERGVAVDSGALLKSCRVGLNPRLGECVGWDLRFYLPGMSTVPEKSRVRR